MNRFFESILDVLTAHHVPRRLRWAETACLAVLLMGGMALWGTYLHWGMGPFTFHDWTAITLPRLGYLQDAVQRGLLPLHISDPLPLAAATDRFMAVPDVILSPQVLLLGLMTPEQFIVVNTWICLAAGSIGMLWLKKVLRLSLFPFTVFYLMFTFNGHILAHMTVGHFTWTAYFLLPWCVGLVFQLFERPAGWGWTLRYAIVMGVLLLNGGYHPFIWTLLFTVMLAVTLPGKFWALLRSMLLAVGLGAVRLLPMVLPLGEFDNKYIGGYPLVKTIWDNLVVNQVPNDITLSGGMTKPIGLWEFTIYVGLLGAGFLAVFGILQTLRARNTDKMYALLLVPICGMAILSLGKVYQYLRIALPVPVLTGERIASRMFVLAFVFLLALAVVALQRWLEANQQARYKAVLAILMTVFLANDLWQNFRLWRIADAAGQFAEKSIVLSTWTVANRADPEYFTLLWVGAGISAACLGLMIFLSTRNKRHTANPAEKIP